MHVTVRRADQMYHACPYSLRSSADSVRIMLWKADFYSTVMALLRLKATNASKVAHDKDDRQHVLGN